MAKIRLDARNAIVRQPMSITAMLASAVATSRASFIRAIPSPATLDFRFDSPRTLLGSDGWVGAVGPGFATAETIRVVAARKTAGVVARRTPEAECYIPKSRMKLKL